MTWPRRVMLLWVGMAAAVPVLVVWLVLLEVAYLRQPGLAFAMLLAMTVPVIVAAVMTPRARGFLAGLLLGMVLGSATILILGPRILQRAMNLGYTLFSGGMILNILHASPP